MSQPPSSAIDQVAQVLIDARRTGRQADAAPWADALTTSDQAFAVQARVAEALGWFDGVPLHWKSGGGSRTATLTHTPLPPAGVRSNGASFAGLGLHEPAVEAEIALQIGQDVDAALAAGLDYGAAVALLSGMTVAVEVVDSRWREGLRAPALLKVADSQVHGGLALGDWVPFQARDWASQSCEVRVGRAAPTTHTGTHSLGDPAWLLPAWLRHATRGGGVLRAGTVVTTGSWAGVIPARHGDEVVVVFPGVGSVQLTI
ncbi:hypothetical protein GCM10023144_09140 [Pigmentiphaga soli]|uniref:Fumarylacetoacetase-like C-terminal domain-containing protein n=1 Tax=Pigmentiphaga soli TaxID=1007095 RepID=A0ABP8GKN7_9BURK